MINPISLKNLQHFKKGVPSNPKGKPKGTLNSKTRYKRMLTMIDTVKNPINGETEKLTVLEIMDLKQIARAMKGNLRAYREILDRLEGKPGQNVDLTSKGEILPTPIYGGVSVSPAESTLEDA